MEFIEIKTLIDITNTDLRRPQHHVTKESNQYRNWITFLQCLGLRCIIDYDYDPIVEEVDVKGLGFGSKYKGPQKVWTFKFNTDVNDGYKDENGQLGLLINDLHQVPVNENLDESINIPKAVFDLADPAWKNTIVVLLDDTTRK